MAARSTKGFKSLAKTLDSKAVPVPYRRRLGMESLEARWMLFGDHEALTAGALSFLKDDVIEEINDENTDQDFLGQFNQGFHFDGNHFSAGAGFINGWLNDAIGVANPEAFDSEELAGFFGRILHSIQDFYSHTNWVDMGRSDLFETGTGLWNVLVPYSTVNGVVMVEGPLPSGVTATRDVFDVTITNGSVSTPGLISGEVTVGATLAPPGLSVPHGGIASIGISGPPLAKDDAVPTNPAFVLAGQQTQHEFKRLVSLIRETYGEEGVGKLVEEWAKPDPASQIALREVLDLPAAGGEFLDLVFVIDTTGSMGDDINAVKAEAITVVEAIQNERPFSRIGIVLYKDFGDSYVATTQLPFNYDKDEIVSAIQSITVGGGGDFPEAVYSGIIHATDELDDLGEWRLEGLVNKVIIAIGDAPAHDPEPTSQPTDSGYRLEDVIEHAARGGVEFDLVGSGLSALSAATLVSPIRIFPIVIGGDLSAVASFQAIANGTGGKLFTASTAEDVVDAILEIIEEGIDLNPDYGDAPDSYGTTLASDGPRHLSSDLFLGASVDYEADGTPSTDADGDDLSATDDEDGVVLPPTLVAGVGTVVTVTASGSGLLDAWIDFDQDGSFDAEDQVAASLPLVAGQNQFEFTTPLTATGGATYARFRISSAGGLSPGGEAVDGEVEDYQVLVHALASRTATLITDPFNPTQTMLLVVGTPHSDLLFIDTDWRNQVTVRSLFSSLGSFSPSAFSRIVVFGLDRGDSICVDSRITLPTEIHGNDGNDLVVGGGGDDDLFGEDGHDLLFGRHGNDLLVGGAGFDFLWGGRGDDELNGQGGDDGANTRASHAPGRLDVNRDGAVSGIDLVLVAEELNKTNAALQSLAGTVNTSADINNDGFVSGIDLVLVAKAINDLPTLTRASSQRIVSPPDYDDELSFDGDPAVADTGIGWLTGAQTNSGSTSGSSLGAQVAQDFDTNEDSATDSPSSWLADDEDVDTGLPRHAKDGEHDEIESVLAAVFAELGK